jgi:predicted nuclease with RNAse H fold
VIVAGIDVAEERKGLDLVVLDHRRNLIASEGRLSLDDAIAILLDIGPEVVCIDSPSAWAHEGKSRRSEIALRKIGITAFSTPRDPGDHPFYRWMRVGFSIYQALAPTFIVYDGSILNGSAIEVFPEATAVLLAGRLRNKGESKRTFRGEVLSQHGVSAENLPTVDRIDAALAALTGVLALEGEQTFVGDLAEGVILLPVSRLPEVKLTRTESEVDKSSGQRPRRVPRAEQIGAPSPATGCECGCGAPVRRRFLPGHDAKLRSRLLQAEASGVSAAKQLTDLGWRS